MSYAAGLSRPLVPPSPIQASLSASAEKKRDPTGVAQLYTQQQVRLTLAVQKSATAAEEEEEVAVEEAEDVLQ